MSKLDSAKEELGWLKVVFAVVVAIDASLVAWIAQAHASASILLTVTACVAVAVLTGAAFWINRLAYRKITRIGESLMIWAPIAALAILVTGLILIVLEA
ncbi:MAG: hypothetical protein ACT4P4_06135, partial [Betaproteobacteria bacterium]